MIIENVKDSQKDELESVLADKCTNVRRVNALKRTTVFKDSDGVLTKTDQSQLISDEEVYERYVAAGPDTNYQDPQDELLKFQCKNLEVDIWWFSKIAYEMNGTGIGVQNGA